jgi:hypothetical protein
MLHYVRQIGDYAPHKKPFYDIFLVGIVPDPDHVVGILKKFNDQIL